MTRLPRVVPRVEGHAGIDVAVFADLNVGADDRAGFDAGTVADDGALAHHRTGANGDAFAELDQRANHGGGMDSSRVRRALEQLGGAGKPEARLNRFDNAHRGLCA